MMWNDFKNISEVVTYIRESKKELKDDDYNYSLIAATIEFAQMLFKKGIEVKKIRKIALLGNKFFLKDIKDINNHPLIAHFHSCIWLALSMCDFSSAQRLSNMVLDKNFHEDFYEKAGSFYCLNL